MATQPNPSFGSGGFGAVRRKTVTVAAENLVRRSFVDALKSFPRLIEPNAEQLNLIDWARRHREELAQELLQFGVILFRGFALETADRFRELAQVFAPLLDYRERAAPRTEVSRSIYTSTEFPPDQIIPMHHEMSYSHNWPTKLWFFCEQSPASGGRTPVVDDRRIFSLIPTAIKNRFMEKKVMYVRNYGEGVDMPWQVVFQTEDRAVVEAYCRKSHTVAEWKDGDRLRTRAVRQAVATHPTTGDTVWFNHAYMFHHSNLEPSVRAALLAEFAEDELPRNAFYGDGTPIEPSILEELKALYEREACRFDWQQGDVMMVDNFLASHGREAFSGPRKILVAMSELYTHPDFADPEASAADNPENLHPENLHSP